MIDFSAKTLFRTLLVAAILVAAPAVSFAGVFVSVAVAPPPLPVYAQPLCPGDGYIWTPGYWAWGPAGYFWVPGAWVLAPTIGYLWTPPYWGWSGGLYVFHAGYWGPHVGFYGGINYGFGYLGHGYEGGAWVNGHFSYNRAYNNINVAAMHSTYVHTVAIPNAGNRVSFNGGAGGIQARPMAGELAAMREPHIQPTAVQTNHQTLASQDRAQLASVNNGRPPLAAARSTDAYRNVATQHAATQPISPNDRTGARNNFAARPTYQPNTASRPSAPANTPSYRPQAHARPQAQSRPQPPARPQPQAHPARPERR